MLSDPDGISRYLGETSGATFLDHLKHFMLTLVPLTFLPDSGDGSSFVASIGQYQTFDSRPLPNPDGEVPMHETLGNRTNKELLSAVDALWLPSPADMTSMLAELRYYIQDGNGEFPCGGIYWFVHIIRAACKINTDFVLSWQVGGPQ